MNWLAWAVQNPQHRAEVAIVLIGKRGTGKGLLGGTMCHLFGGHAVHISNAMHLAGRFNEHMRNTSWLFADEAYWPGDKNAEGTLKRLITEYFLFVEPKFRGGFMARNMLHVLMAANEGWPVPAGEKERRFEIFRVSEAQLQKDEYFTPIYNQLDDGGYEAMLWDLQHMDLDEFHPRLNPKSGSALLEVQAQSLDPLDTWWVELLENGQLPGSHPECPNRAITNGYEAIANVDTHGGTFGSQTRVKVKGLVEHARDSDPRLRWKSYHAIGQYLGAKERGCKPIEKVQFHRRSGWEFPPLKEARAAWEKRYPGWPWRLPDKQDWDFVSDEDAATMDLYGNAVTN
jgi:hypothetical protein